jgi:TRAP-type C4-dicarboxylate transport system permease small subunit
MSTIRAAVERVLEWTLVVLMGAMVVNVLWQVATRFLLRHPSSYTEEVARYLLVWVGLLGASYAAGKRIHLSIDLLPEKLHDRRRHLLLLFVEVCIFAFALLVLVVGGSSLVGLTLSLGQTSAALQVPLGYVYLVLPLSGLLMMFFSAMHAADELHWARAGGTGEDHAGDHEAHD